MQRKLENKPALPFGASAADSADNIFAWPDYMAKVVGVVKQLFGGSPSARVSAVGIKRVVGRAANVRLRLSDRRRVELTPGVIIIERLARRLNPYPIGLSDHILMNRPLSDLVR